MKKLLLIGLCFSLFAGSANQVKADWRQDAQKGLVAAVIVAGSVAIAGLAWGIGEIAVYVDARLKLISAKNKNPETFELLEKINLFTFDFNDAAKELLSWHNASEYPCLESIAALDRVIAGLTSASRGFRNSQGLILEKYYLLRKKALEQQLKIDALIKNANDIALVIKNNSEYYFEAEEIERRQKEARQHEIDLINARQPKNQIQVKNVV